MTLYLYIFTFFSGLASFCYSSYFLKENEKKAVALFYVFILLTISTLRWKVGGDWESYFNVYKRSDVSFLTFNWSFIYELINFIIKKIGLGIWGINLVIVMTYFFALNCLSRTLKLDFFLLVLISFSLIYFNIIMGYVRQSLSLSLLMYAAYYLYKNNRLYSLIFFLLSSMTHISVLIFLPIWIYAFRDRIILLLSMACIIGILIYGNLGSLIVQVEQFVIKNYVSTGAYLRVITLLGCLISFFIFHKKIISKSKNFNFYLYYNTFISIIFIFIMFTVSSMTALIDRISVYFSFYQLIIIGAIFREYIPKNKKIYIHTASFVSIFYFVILYIWFLFGDYSIFWLEYNFIAD